MKRALSLCGRFVALVVLHAALFVVGSRLFPLNSSPPDATQAGRALMGLLGCAVIDTSLLALWASGTRLRGWRRWAALSWAFYGAKTLSSALEALWFMPNVSRAMAPSLFAMTLPLCLLLPLAVIAAFGAREPVSGPAWHRPAASMRHTIAAWGLLAGLIYPLLFWGAGYFIAFQSPAVRAFYGGLQGNGFFAHFTHVFAADPWVVPFEVFRGLLWIAMVLPLMRSSTRRWQWDALLVGAFLALVQNDVHLLPNPLMTAEIQLYHFLETASSNFIWGLALVGLLRGWLERRAGAGMAQKAALLGH